MTFDWLDYLTLAKNLAGQTVIVSEQAKLRSAIRGKLIVYGQVILFILLYTLNVLIVMRIFGQLELLEITVLLEFYKEIRYMVLDWES